jgi:Holliday junction resolvasome RuvABC endonuclease subunit
VTRIIGLDLSTASTGVATPDGKVRSIRPVTKDPDRRRHEILDRLEPYLRLGCDVAVIEQYFVGRFSNARLVELHGAVKTRLFEHSIPYVLVSPSTLKKFVLGHAGSAKQKVTKQQIVDAAVACGVDVANDDEADSWWLHAMGRMRFDRWQPPYRALELRDVREGVLAGLEWPRVSERAGLSHDR